MDDEPTGQDRHLQTLERLLGIEILDLRSALNSAAGLIGQALRADKVDAFFYHPEKETLVSEGTSDTPMGRKQIAIGMDRMPIVNGGRAVEVFQTGRSFLSGHADEDPVELVGITRGLGIRSEIITPLDVGGERRGVLLASSATPDFFTESDVRFLEAAARWVGLVESRARLIDRVEREAIERGRQLAAEELVTILAHDLRNYLVPIRGRIDLIRRRARREGRPRDVVDADEAMRAIDRLHRLISELLDVARLEEGIFTIMRQPIDLVRLVEDVAAAFRMATTPIDVEAPDELIVEADLDRVGQALENVVSNAVKHSPPSAPITITVDTELRDEGPCAVIDVRDRGPGVLPEILPRLFERFNKGAESTGLGLGLYLARRILETHGGSIGARLNPEGGTTFSLRLPIDQPVP